MSTRNLIWLPGVIGALALPSYAPAAAAVSHQCAQLWDDSLRLGCYDTAFGKPRPPADVAVSPASAAAPAAAASAAPAAAAAAGTVALAAPAAAASRPAASAPAEATAKDDKKGGNLVATVTGVSQTLDGRLRVTLDNGETWQQTEVESINPVRTGGEQPYQLFQVKVGDQVTVKSGVMGSRQMIAKDGRDSRVQLVK